MNVDELREELSARAESASSGEVSQRLTGVRARIAAHRRARRAGIVAGTALAAAVAVLLAPSVVDRAASPRPVGPATSTVPSIPPEASASFPQRIDGDTLIASRLNRAGESTVRWRLSLPALDVLTSIYCNVPADFHPRAVQNAQLMMFWAVNGKDFYGHSCSPQARPGASGATGIGSGSKANASQWQRAGVRPGRPFTITMRLELRGKQVTVPKARFGLALYARTGRTVTAHGVALPRVLEGTQPGRFVLGDYLISPVSDGRQVSLQIPASDRATMVRYGWWKLGVGGRLVAYSDGRSFSGSTGGGVQTDRFDSTDSHTLSVRARGGARRGALVIAYYRQTS